MLLNKIQCSIPVNSKPLKRKNFLVFRMATDPGLPFQLRESLIE